VGCLLPIKDDKNLKTNYRRKQWSSVAPRRRRNNKKNDEEPGKGGRRKASLDYLPPGPSITPGLFCWVVGGPYRSLCSLSLSLSLSVRLVGG